MKDILLTPQGDLLLTETGDIKPIDSTRQAVRIRLQWFLNEWRFSPQYGVPYYEEILVKQPNIERIRRIIRDEVMSVDEVVDAKNIQITINPANRSATVTLDVVTTDETYREEVQVYA